MTSSAPTLFGRNVAAMITPMLPDGSLDLVSTHALVDHLVRRGCDGLVVCGTTGEAPTLSDDELAVVVRATRSGSRESPPTRAPTPCSSSPRTTRGPPSAGSSRTSRPCWSVSSSR